MALLKLLDEPLSVLLSPGAELKVLNAEDDLSKEAYELFASSGE